MKHISTWTYVFILIGVSIYTPVLAQANANCQSFNSATNRCTTCTIGYGITETGICVQVRLSYDPLCTLYSTNGDCMQCGGVSLLNTNGVCARVPVNCAQLNSTTFTCARCVSGYILNVSTRQCQTLLAYDSLCSSWNNVPVCTRCNSVSWYNSTAAKCTRADSLCATFNPINGKCYTCTGVKYKVMLTGKCVLRPKNMTNPYCTKWKTLFESENQQCVTCDQGTFINPKNICIIMNPLCQDYNLQTGACLTCPPGYRLIKDTCDIDYRRINDPSCKTFNENDLCVECKSRYWYSKDKKKCQRAASVCKTYSLTTGQCTSCFIGFLLRSGDCIIDLRPATNPACQQWNDTGCVKCPSSFLNLPLRYCVKKTTNCATHDMTNGRCVACNTGFNLQGLICVVATTIQIDPNCATQINGLCLSCKNRFYLLGQKCTPVSQLCNSYNNVTGACISCANGFRMVQTVCTPTQTTLDSTTLLCISRVNQLCTKCYQPSQLIGGFCLQTFTNTDPNCQIGLDGLCALCKQKYYVDSTGLCVPITPNCSQFKRSLEVCSVCNNGFKLTVNACI